MAEIECSNCIYNKKIVEKLRTEKPDENTISRLADTFKVFGDNTRIKILWNLFDKELSVTEICEALDMSQSAISHQLRILKQARLIAVRREGKNAFYSLDDDHVKRIIEQVLIHTEEKD